MTKLPTLSTLHENSALFTRAYTPCPQSSPARASVFTGLDPCVHGLWSNGVTLRESERTFAQRLALAGYSTYLAGRYQLSGVSHWTTEQCRANEFTQFDWAHGPLHRSRQNGYLSWLQKTIPKHYARLFTTQANPESTNVTSEQAMALNKLSDESSFNHWVGKRVNEWISTTSSNKPLLAVAGFSIGNSFGAAPHLTSDGEGFNQRALQQADAAIGKMLKHLEAEGRANDTVVIVCAARGNTALAEPESAMKESSIRVPLLIQIPQQLQQKIIESPVSTIDIAPTLLALANVPTGPRMQGRSLLGVINGSDAPRGWALSRLRSRSPTGENNWQTALCTDTMKLVVRHCEQSTTKETMRLYKLDKDPFEQNNLASSLLHATDLEGMIDQMIDARCALEDRTEPRIAEF